MGETANVDLVNQVYAATARGDLEQALALMTDDVTFVVPGPPGVGASGVWRGHDGVRTCFARLKASQDSQGTTIRHVVAQGDKVVVLLRAKATARATGKPLELDIVHFFTIRDGRIAELLDFFDTAAVVDAFTPVSC